MTYRYFIRCFSVDEQTKYLMSRMLLKDRLVGYTLYLISFILHIVLVIQWKAVEYGWLFLGVSVYLFSHTELGLHYKG